MENLGRVLVTGAAGYIGSHTCIELLQAGYQVHAIDSLVNSKWEALKRVEHITKKKMGFTKCDIRNFSALSAVIEKFKPDVVVHFAGLKAVGESVAHPSKYYDVNVGGTAVLLSAMEKAKCENIVFSSSATVYGIPTYLPCDEQHPLQPINPYGSTKMMCEQLLRDWTAALENRRAVTLRYFNPAGAHISGQIGEDPNGTPNNLMPLLARAAGDTRYTLSVYGTDYSTHDGSGIRDYIHVVDLARSHKLAVEKINTLLPFEVINIGTGKGISVLQMISEFQRQSNAKINLQFEARRTGDAPEVWSDVSSATEKLGFTAKLGIDHMCSDTWRWKSQNPNGYID